MEKEIKHRLKRSRRRERAERMQAQRDHGDSAEDETLSGVKPHRPPIRRKKAKEPIFEEDIIDGFAILAFRSYEELEMAVKMATTKNSKYNSLGEDKMRNQANLRVINRHSPAPGHDAGTSDDSGRASEVRPPGLPHSQRESSHDRLSDASSRCSSERGYICDSEGEDDKGSDAGSLFAATPVSTPRKHETADSGGAQGALLTNGVASPPRTGALANVSPPGTVPLQPNGLAENARNSMGATLPNFQSPHFDKTLEGERTTKPRMDNLALNSNEKTRAEINCQTLDKRLETNTHVENKRIDGNTHQQMVSNFDKRLDGHLNHLEKGRIEGMHHDKNLLDKSRLDSVHLEKSRVDGLPVHVLENAPVPSHLDKRTLDIASGQVNKCLENSVHAPLSLDKRKDSLATGIMDKGRLERDMSMAHAPVSSPTHGSAIPNPGAPGSHVHSPALPNNHPHQQAVHPGGNTIPHKPMHQNQMYQNSMRTHLHNSGLPSQNVPPMQFPPKKPLFLHNLNLSPSSRPLNAPTTSSVPLTTTSVSLVISTSNLTSSSSSVSNSGIYNLSTTLSLSNNGAVSHNPMGVHQHSTHSSVNHMSNQSRSLNESLPPRPVNSPQPGGVLRTASDLNQTMARTNTPSAGQPPGLGTNHATSHTMSQVHGRVTPSVISSASSTPTTSTTLSAVVSLSSHAELPVTSTVSSHSGLSLHSSMPSGGNLLNHVGAQGSGSPGIHSGYSLPLSNSSYAGYPPLYGPYGSNLQHNPYLPPRIEPPASIVASSLSKQQSIVSGTIASSVCATSVVTTSTTTSHRDIITTPAVGRTHSPRGHSPTRERDSYSSNVSSLSRGSTTPVNGAPSASPFSSAPSSSLPNPSSYVKNPVWVSTPGPGPAKPSLHPSNFPPPMFAPPLPPSAAPPGPAPFSAESLFQTNQADLLRRELDNRFLASQERTLGVPAFLRTEMHHHQHQHTHVHQHQAAALYPPPLFKEIPKLGGVDSPFYRGNLGLASYPGFSPGLLGPGLPSTPFAPPSHLPTFTPKQVGDVSKPRIAKTGKWNAMHVRVAWEIYHHQQKQAAESKSTLGSSGSKDTLLRPSGHLFPPAGPPHEFARYPTGFLPPPPHIGSTVSPFGRYPPMGSFGPPPASTFSGISGFPSRDISSLGPLPTVHDPWRLRAPNAFPVGPSPWSLKPDPSAIDRRETEEREREREREREKERIRREREERERDRERREREEKRKLEMERERREKERRELERRELERFNKVRERSPIRNGEIKEESRPGKEDDIVILGRSGPGGPYPPHSFGIGRHPGLRPPPLTPHFTPSGWPPPGADPYAYRLDPLLRYNPLVPYRQEEEEQRAKLYGVGGFLPPHAPHHPSSSPVLLKKEESQSR